MVKPSCVRCDVRISFYCGILWTLYFLLAGVTADRAAHRHGGAQNVRTAQNTRASFAVRKFSDRLCAKFEVPTVCDCEVKVGLLLSFLSREYLDKKVRTVVRTYTAAAIGVVHFESEGERRERRVSRSARNAKNNGCPQKAQSGASNMAIGGFGHHSVDHAPRHHATVPQLSRAKSRDLGGQRVAPDYQLSNR